MPRKSKNKVWIADKQEKSSQAGPSQGTTASAVGTVQSHPSVFAGREVKTARGNKQWVASSLTGRTHRKSNSGLVSLRGDSFVQDRSGKKLKRLSSSSKLAQAVKRRSVSEVAKSPSVKQFLARCSHLHTHTHTHTTHTHTHTHTHTRTHTIVELFERANCTCGIPSTRTSQNSTVCSSTDLVSYLI